MASAEVISVTTTGILKIKGCLFEGNTVGGGAMMLLSPSGTDTNDNFITNCTFSGTVFANGDESTLLLQNSKGFTMNNVVFHSSVRPEGRTHEFYEVSIKNSEYTVFNLCFGTEIVDGDNIGSKVTVDDTTLTRANIDDEIYTKNGWSQSFFGRSECGWATPFLPPRTQDYMDARRERVETFAHVRMFMFVYTAL